MSRSGNSANDWLVVGQIVPSNPASSVRGPKHVVRKGKTPVLTAEEARELIDAIDTSTVSGLRDRALIGVMVYSFARVGAVVNMNVEDCDLLIFATDNFGAQLAGNALALRLEIPGIFVGLYPDGLEARLSFGIPASMPALVAYAIAAGWLTNKRPSSLARSIR